MCFKKIFLGLSIFSISFAILSINNQKQNNTCMEETNLLSDCKSSVQKYDFAYNDLNSRYPDCKNNLKISKIKKLSDCSGGKYNIVEFSPFGYTIYDESFTQVIEMTNRGISPYKDFNDNLVYLGFQQYYHLKESKSNNSKLEYYDGSYEVELNESNLNIAKNTSTELNSKVSRVVEEKKNGSNSKGTTTEYAAIYNTNRIRHAETTGYNHGNCGYVAAGLLIYYAALDWGRSYLIDGNFLTKQVVDDIQGDREDASWALQLDDALNEYMIARGDKHDPRVNMWHIPSFHTVYDRVKEDKPVELFCRVPFPQEKIDHAIVVYKVKRTAKSGFLGITNHTDYEFTAHMGYGTYYNEYIISETGLMIAGMVNLHK